MKSNRLGKGLGALIPETEVVVRDETQENLTEIDVQRVKPNPYQPRLKFNAQALDDLKNSIREKGIIQPITVRRHDSGFELIAGERRLRAAIEAGLKKIPAYIIKVDTKEEMLELALVENVQRERLNPIEQATAFERLIAECNLTQDEVAKKIGKDRSTITNTLRLLKLPEDIQVSLEQGNISVGHARTLISVQDDQVRKRLWHKILDQGISVRQLEKLIKDINEVNKAVPTQTARKSPYIQKIEENLRNTFGTKVLVRSKKEGGSIDIEFYSPEDLNRLLEIFEKLE
jgi:ParB family transcriptional regulator, chromosome partitioning protein